MSLRTHWALLALYGLTLAMAVPASAAEPPATKPPEEPVGDYSRPKGDAAAVARGKQVFSVNCGFCHGSNARGGEGGPNLLHSPVVLNDQKGEIIGVIVQTGRPDKGMPKFDFPKDAIADIAAYLHSIPAGRESPAFDPKTILVGNAAAGKTFFFGKGRCSQCHSLEAKGDLQGIGSKYDPKTLQDNIVSGAAVGPLGAPLPTSPPRTVTVTTADGNSVKGNLTSVDEFAVSLTDEAGNRRSFRRQGDSPRVSVTDPMQAHLDMLREWDDTDIHNLTAFLAKQK
jgi:mono/diheme cytochrome c family protein